MKWLLQRAFLVCLALTMIFAGVVALVRLNRTPSTLQQIGFDVCDGEPCFRGAKLGMDWATARSLLPSAVMTDGHLEVPINIANVGRADIFPSKSGTSVNNIILQLADTRVRGLQIPAGEIVTHYGYPCRLLIQQDPSGPSTMIFIYPKLTVFVSVLIGDPYDIIEHRLQASSSAWEFWLLPADKDFYGDCYTAANVYSGSWQGFTTAGVYEARFRRAADTAARCFSAGLNERSPLRGLKTRLN